MSALARRASVATAAAVVLVASSLGSVPTASAAGAPRSAAATTPTASTAAAHGAHAAQAARVAAANGLVHRSGGPCGSWYEVRVAGALSCSVGPEGEPTATAAATAATAAAPATASANSGAAASAVTCIGNGTDGKRVQLLYARPSSQVDHYAATAATMKGWATGIDKILVDSAAKTGGVRKVRWVHDGSCVPTVLNVGDVPSSVTSFDALVSFLHGRYSDKARKYIVAWDDDDTTSKFCGLSQTAPDSTAGPTNLNETQNTTAGAMFAVVENGCWTAPLAAHEMMHTLGAVQNDAPHATGSGHCKDESDLMCYVDGPGITMSQVCPVSQDTLFDCNDDDYFNANPPVGNYLRTHWNAATSGWLDAAGSSGPPTAPQAPASVPGPGRITLSWSPPSSDGGSPILAYLITLSPSGRTITVAAPATTATITGLADATGVTATVVAINRWGTSPSAAGASVVPSPPVVTTATTPDGQLYEDMARAADGSVFVAGIDRIDQVDAGGTKTTVVTGTGIPTEGTAPLQTPVHATSLAVAPNGDLYFYDSLTAKIRRLSGGVVTSVGGNGTLGTSIDGLPALASPIRVDGLAVAPDGAVLFADAVDHIVRRFPVGGTIATVAGISGQPGAGGDGAAATLANLDAPTDLATDAAGAVFVADTGNDRVRRFTVGGTISTVAGDGTATRSPAATVTATATGVPAPRAIDWSADKGLLIDSDGLVRALVGTNLVRLAGDPFNASATDVDGTPASIIDYSKHDSIEAVTWATGRLHVLSLGPLPAGTGRQGKLRSAGPWSPAAAATVPPALVVAPVAEPRVSGAVVRWVPAGNGGGTISGYKVTASPGGATVTVAATALQATIGGLAIGQAYTFTVAAVNEKGTGPASAASNTVVPTAPTPYYPFSTWTTLVSRQYQDLANRLPTSSELNSWVAALSSGGSTKGELDDALRRSAENLSNVDPVVRVYRAFLGRAPDAGGLQFWIKRRRNVAPAKTWSVTQIAESFTASSEFKAKYGSLTNRQFVTRIYTDVLGRTADSAGVDYWTKKLDTRSKTKAQVMVGFSESNEYKTKQAQKTDVTIAFVYLVGRAPTAGEIADWVTREKAGTAHAVLLDEVLSSAAYAARITG